MGELLKNEGFVDEERTLNGGGDGSRLQSKAGDCGREKLTAKARYLRGLRYFAWVFVVFFALNMLAFDFAPGASVGEIIALVLLGASLPAAVAGGIVVLFSRRRLWHGLLAVGVALLVALLMGIV